MLQALLALALVVAFLPMFVKKVADKNAGRENVAVVHQIEAAFEAARAFVYEESDGFPNGVRVFSGDVFVQTLEPYGLPLGFVPRTALGQSVSLLVSRDEKNLLAALVVSGGKLDRLRRAEIVARVGFWGMEANDDGSLAGATGGWSMSAVPNDVAFDPDDILVLVPEDEEFSELVARSARNPDKNVFHTDINMDGNAVASVASLSAESGKIKNVAASEFLLSGIEPDRKSKNEIGSVRAGRVWFSAPGGNPLTIVRSDLRTGLFSATSVANYGDAPNLTAAAVSARDFVMAAGKTGFTGPAEWTVNTAADFTNITLGVERLTLSSFLDTSRGQDIFLNDDGSSLEYTAGSGIRARTLKTDNIIFRDQISSELLGGGTGDALLEIRPAGTTSLPDALIAGINNDQLKIPVSAEDNSGKLETCRAVITRLGGKYNSASLADNIVCRFVLYNRIERRIEIKKCLLDGGTNCT
jgi:hypothetical protein